MISGLVGKLKVAYGSICHGKDGNDIRIEVNCFHVVV